MFRKKECVAMLLAGGQGSRLYALTAKTAKNSQRAKEKPAATAFRCREVFAACAYFVYNVTMFATAFWTYHS